MELSNQDLQLLAEEFKLMLDKANVEVANLNMLYKKEKFLNNSLSQKIGQLEEKVNNLEAIVQEYDQQNLQNN